MATLHRSINPNVITHDIKVRGLGTVQVADDMREGYGDEISFGHLVQDTLGEVTGNNKLAVMAGENARQTFDERSDLVFANIARQQAEMPTAPAIQLYPHTNERDMWMVVCYFDSESEKRIAAVAHCFPDAGGDWDNWDHRIVETRVL